MNIKFKKMLYSLLIAVLLPLLSYASGQTEIYSPLRGIEVSGSLNSNGHATAIVKNVGTISRNIKLQMKMEQNNEIIAVSSVNKMIIPNEEKSFELSAPVPATADTKLYIAAEYGKPAKELYVAKNGDDRNDGSFSSPFATIDRAKKEIRAIKHYEGLSDGGITVYIRGGEYTFDSSIYFSGMDSGYENAPVTYTAYNNESVKIKGSKTIFNETFTNAGFSDSNILKADLRQSGIFDFGEIIAINSFNLDSSTPSSTMLYENDEVQTIARYPNKAGGNAVYLKIGNVSGTGDKTVTFQHNITAFNPAVKWSGEDIWTRGFFRYYWYEDAKRATVTNTQATLRETTAFGILKDQEYYFFNILAELDQENEFYIDRENGFLYYYPSGGINGKNLELSFLETPFFVMNNVKNVYFSNISFVNSRFSGITTNNCENILIEGCKFSGLGGQAVNIKGGKNCGVLSSDIHSTGRGGIRLDGGDRIKLTPSGHYVENCDIYDFSLETSTYNPAIYLSGVGNFARNNKIHEGPHMGIAVVGNDHIIEYNEIYNLCKNSHDGGAIYGGRDWTQCGNIIRNNYFHDIMGKRDIDRPEAHAVYFDDMMSGNTVTDNVFYNVHSGVMLHGSRSTTITGNIFVNMERYSVTQTNITNAQNPNSYDSELRVNYRKIFTELADHQMAVPADGAWAKYNGQPIDGHPNYRRLDKIPYDQPNYPKYNVISNNYLYNAPDISVTSRARESGDFSNNQTISFVDLNSETKGMGTYTDKWRKEE